MDEYMIHATLSRWWAGWNYYEVIVYGLLLMSQIYGWLLQSYLMIDVELTTEQIKQLPGYTRMPSQQLRAYPSRRLNKQLLYCFRRR